MATSTYKSFLMTSTDGSSYSKLCDITEYPDLGQEPELLDTTSLSDGMRTYIMGIQGNEGMTFNANYDHDTYESLKALEGTTKYYAVWFGATVSGGVATPTGTEGKFSFQGELSVRVTGGSVNEVRGMSITIAPSTEIDFE